MALSAPSPFHLFGSDSIAAIFADPPSFHSRGGVEVGWAAGFVIAPLIRAFRVNGRARFLRLAGQSGDRLFSLFDGRLLAPFSGVETGLFGTRCVLLDSIGDFPSIGQTFVNAHRICHLSSEPNFFTTRPFTFSHLP
jgi:hypothetical protein